MFAFKITLKPHAAADLDRMRRYDVTLILDAVERHLQFEPTRESRSRIKRLRGPIPPITACGFRITGFSVAWSAMKFTFSGSCTKGRQRSSIGR